MWSTSHSSEHWALWGTKALLDTLANTVAEVEAETLDNKPGDCEAKALIDSLAVTLQEAKVTTLGIYTGRSGDPRAGRDAG